MFSRFHSLEYRGGGDTLDKLITVKEHVFILVLLTLLLVEHQLELIGVHRVGIECTEGITQVRVDVRFRILVLCS